MMRLLLLLLSAPLLLGSLAADAEVVVSLTATLRTSAANAPPSGHIVLNWGQYSTVPLRAALFEKEVSITGLQVTN
jgi:hypothetical protein